MGESNQLILVWKTDDIHDSQWAQVYECVWVLLFFTSFTIALIRLIGLTGQSGRGTSLSQGFKQEELKGGSLLTRAADFIWDLKGPIWSSNRNLGTKPGRLNHLPHNPLPPGNRLSARLVLDPDSQLLFTENRQNFYPWGSWVCGGRKHGCRSKRRGQKVQGVGKTTSRRCW